MVVSDLPFRVAKGAKVRVRLFTLPLVVKSDTEEVSRGGV